MFVKHCLVNIQACAKLEGNGPIDSRVLDNL